MGGPSEVGRVIGRYVLYDPIATGGMATVHLGRLLGQVGFARVVAIKRLHPHLAKDPDFVAMFLDEARVAASINHPNVVHTVDVVALEGELFLIMEYVEGDSLSHLIRDTRRRGQLVDPRIVSSVVAGACFGLHAAHTTTDQLGRPLQMVHRDVSPQNIQVGTDGVARVLDFGVAKAARRIQETNAGQLKGKFSYMAPEMVRHDEIDQRSDIFSAGICLWEALTGKFLFHSEEPGRTIAKVLEMPIPAPSSVVPDIPPALDEIAARALERNRDKRYQTARELAIALEDAMPPLPARRVGEWVDSLVGPAMRARQTRLAELATAGTTSGPMSLVELQLELKSGTPSRPSHPIPEPPPSPRPADVEQATSSIGPVLPEAPEPEPEPPPADVPARDTTPSPLIEPPAIAPPEPPPVQASPAEPTPEPAPEPEPAAPEPAAPEPAFEPAAQPISQVSQVSQVSVASYAGPLSVTVPPKNPRLRLAVASVMLAAAALLVVALLVSLLRSTEDEDPVVGVPSEPAPTPSPARVEPPEPRPVEIAPIPTPAPPAAPSTSVAEPAPKPTTKKPPAPRPNCNPPYTIDASGIKKYKRHCL